MKKQLLTLLALLLTIKSYSQSFKSDSNIITQAPNATGYILDTVSTSRLTKQQLYSNALSFLTSRFKDSRSVIENKDLELGEINFKGNTTKPIIISDATKKGKISSYKWNVGLSFKCKIFLKDQKFKIVLYSLEKQPIAGSPGSALDPFDNKIFIKENKAGAEMAMEIIKDLSESLNKKPENDF